MICKTSGAAGGIICLVNDDGNAFVGCENYGLVITGPRQLQGHALRAVQQGGQIQRLHRAGRSGRLRGRLLCAGRRELHELHVLHRRPQCDGRACEQPEHPLLSQRFAGARRAGIRREPFVGRAECAGQQCRRRTAFVGRLRLDGERRRGLGACYGPFGRTRRFGCQGLRRAVYQDRGRCQYEDRAAVGGRHVRFDRRLEKRDGEGRSAGAGRSVPQQVGVPSFDAAALRLVVDRRQRHSCDIGRGGLHFGRARRCECFGRFQAERRYEPSCGFDDGRGRLPALYLPGGESRRQIGRRFQRHDGG